jgi:predicted nucleotidyltransferase
MRSDALEAQLDAALAALDAAIEPPAAAAVYLYGSAVDGGLRPDSDLDLLIVTRRRATTGEKGRLVEELLPISGRESRPPSWRPLELTIVVQAEVRPWRYPPRCDFQYGEWLRGAFLGGEREPWPEANPDLAVVLTMVQTKAHVLLGPPPSEIVDPVPREDLLRAMIDGLGPLLADLEPDTRNVLLTLARMWTTAASGEIRSKDAAADWAVERLPAELRPVLASARDLYRAGGYGKWQEMDSARAAADFMVERLVALARVGEGER